MPNNQTQVPSPKQFHTVSEAAKLLNVHPNTVYRMLNDGTLEGIRVRRRRRITNLDEFVESQKHER